MSGTTYKSTFKSTCVNNLAVIASLNGDHTH